MTEVAEMYGHRWIAHHDLDTGNKGFKCLDCEVIDFETRAERNWMVNLPPCKIQREVNEKGENVNGSPERITPPDAD